MKVFALLVSVYLFISCSIVDMGNDWLFLSNLTQHDMIELPSDFRPWNDENLEDLWQYTTWYIWSKIVYKVDVKDSWDSPATTLARGYGDCDDISILFMNLIYKYNGMKLDLALVDTNNRVQSRAVVDGGWVNHALVRTSDGTIIEPQRGWVVEYSKVGFVYYFDQVFKH